MCFNMMNNCSFDLFMDKNKKENASFDCLVISLIKRLTSVEKQAKNNIFLIVNAE